MKNLYKQIVERLESEAVKEKFQQANITPVQYIDFYNEQNIYWEKEEYIPLPAVLFDFDIDIKNKTASITLHCCYEDLENTSNLVSDHAFNFLTFAELVAESLEDLESEKTGKLEPLTESISKGSVLTPTYLLTYECSFDRCSGVESSRFITARGEELNVRKSLMKNLE